MSYGLGSYITTSGPQLIGPGTGNIPRISWTTGQEASMGLGCACGGDCGNCGNGLGLFDSGFDLTQWGWPEYAVAAFAVYALFGAWTTTKRGVRSAGERIRKTRRKVGGVVAGRSKK